MCFTIATLRYPVKVRAYRQFCGIARAADVLGERWALLIVRDLLLGPLRFSELRDGLPGISTNILTTRLKELEAAGVLRREAAPAPARGLVYVLTDYGRDVEDILDALGRWGARRMAAPDEGDVITDASLAAALRATFTGRTPARPVTVEFRVGPACAHAVLRPDGSGTPAVDRRDSRSTVDDAGRETRPQSTGIVARPGPASTPDLSVTTTTGFRDLLAGRIDAAAFAAAQDVTLTGDDSLLPDVADAFHAPLDPEAE